MGVLKTWDKSKQEWVATATAVPTFDTNCPGGVYTISIPATTSAAQGVISAITTSDFPAAVNVIGQKWTCQEDGYYTFYTSLSWNGANGGTYTWYVNGAEAKGEWQSPVGTLPNLMVHLEPGDWVTPGYWNINSASTVSMYVVQHKSVKGDKGAKGDAGADAPDTYAELSDTDMTGIVTDDIPRWDGSAWKPGKAADPSGSTSLAWPVGSIFLTVDDADPSTLLGFGTWARIAQDRTLMGRDPSGTYGTTEAEVGAAVHGHVYTDVISHSHGVNISDPSHAHGVNDGGHYHVEMTESGAGTGTWHVASTTKAGTRNTANTTAAASAGVSIQGAYTGVGAQVHATGIASGTTQDGSNVQPGLVVNIWKRTA